MRANQDTTVVHNPGNPNVHGHPGQNPVVHHPIPPFHPGYMPGYNPFAFYAHPNQHHHHQGPQNQHGHQHGHQHDHHGAIHRHG